MEDSRLAEDNFVAAAAGAELAVEAEATLFAAELLAAARARLLAAR